MLRGRHDANCPAVRTLRTRGAVLKTVPGRPHQVGEPRPAAVHRAPRDGFGADMEEAGRGSPGWPKLQGMRRGIEIAAS